MTTHPIDQIETYLTDGLTDAERAEFEAHVASCPSCAAALEMAKQADTTVDHLFARVRPVPGMEDRVVQRLRVLPRGGRPLIHPFVRRAAVGIAATVLVGTAGYVANAEINGQRFWAIASSTRGVKPVSGIVPSARAYYGEFRQFPGLDTKFSTDETTFPKDAVIAAGEPARDAVAHLSIQQKNDNSVLLSKNESRSVEEEVSRKKPEASAAPAAAPAPINLGYAEAVQKQAAASYYRWNDAQPSPAEPGALPMNGPAKGAELGLIYKETPSLATGRERQLNETVGGRGIQTANGGQEYGRYYLATGAKPGIADLKRAQDAGGTTAGVPDQGQQTATVEGKPVPNAESSRGDAPKPNAPAPADDANATSGRKVIRNGEMEFEVDSFDSAVNQMSKIVGEEGGFVSTTESDKLPNGKVKGRVVLRCPPQRLDTLVLKLRGIGDLRTQRIGAQDITKQYTDLESGLRAAQAMQDRLLDIIKTGKGQVKDLLEAEKQLGVWREKIEQLQGEIRYYNNLVSLSTLSITLYERDIKTPASASETETVMMSLETDHVEEAYQKAREAIDRAKGRITASELKQFDAGQYRATLSALLPPDQAEAVIARVRQLDGRLAHFERQRSQSTSNGQQQTTRAEPLRVQREDVVVNLTIYNLANIAPRRTSTILLVAPDVEAAYHSLIDQVNAAGGKVVTSTINHPSPEQINGAINFNVPADKADILLAAIRGTGEIVKSDTSESPDTQNVTDSKRGFSLTVASLDAFRARETQQIQLSAPDVPAAFNEVLNAARGKVGRVIHSQLNEQDRQNIAGTIEFWAPREAIPAIEQALHKSSDVVSRMVTRSNDTENTVDTKVQFQVTLTSADRLPARETVQTQLVATSVSEAFNAIRAAIPPTGRILVSELNELDPQNVTAQLVFDLSASTDAQLSKVLDKYTAAIARQVKGVPEGQVALERTRYQVTLTSADRQSPRQTVQVGVEARDADKAADDFVAAATNSGGRAVDNPSRSEDNAGHVTATVVVDVPLDRVQAVLTSLDQLGERRQKQMSVDTKVPENRLSRARIEATFSNSAASLGGQESLSDYLRNGILTSLKGLGYSLMCIVIGICLIAPWALILWAAWKVMRRSRARRQIAFAGQTPGEGPKA